MYALKINPTNDVQIVEFPKDEQYEIISEAVGGQIECVHIAIGDSRFDMWVNEEGTWNGLPYNSMATQLYQNNAGPSVYIVGSVLISGTVDSRGNSRGLSKKSVKDIFAQIDSNLTDRAVLALVKEM